MLGIIVQLRLPMLTHVEMLILIEKFSDLEVSLENRLQAQLRD